MVHEGACLNALTFLGTPTPQPRLIDEPNCTQPEPDSITRPTKTPVLPLSPREQEVLTLLKNGHDIHHMSRKLSISVFTLRNHIQAIYRKRGVSSRQELLSARRSA
jgi:DNA-binding NarL/FixJ family response regulator